MKTRIAVLCSGGGSNLQAIIDSIEAGNIDGEIVLVLANASKAFALERARRHGIPCEFVSRKQAGSAEAFNDILLDKLRAANVDLIVLAGYLPIVGAQIVRAYPHRIINIHPALIPAFCGDGFYGLHVHEAALAKGVKVSGATVHFVNAVTDGGPIIAQKAVCVEPDDTPETLQKRIMAQAEHILLPQAVSLFCDGRLLVENNIVRVTD